jgi:CubicO group peptidase (beta-lactamase class C family)
MAAIDRPGDLLDRASTDRDSTAGSLNRLRLTMTVLAECEVRPRPALFASVLTAMLLAIPVKAEPLPRADPGSLGIDPAGIEDFIAGIEAEGLRVHSFMLVRHGRVAAEGWWRPYRAELPHPVYSITKSFTATAVAFAINEGRLALDGKVVDYLPALAPASPSPNLAAMRVRDLLTMTAGHARDPLPAAVALAQGNDQIRAVLAQPVAFTPGGHFAYSSGAALLLAGVIQNVTGETLSDYLNPRLFAPIGITSAVWAAFPDGLNPGHSGLSLTTEDIARFGLLYLQKGRWGDRAVLPQSWVDAATRHQVDSHYGTNPDFAQGYGYMFWLTRHDAYRAFGSLDQNCLVFPACDAVLVVTAENYDTQSLARLIWKNILPALRSQPATVRAADASHLLGRLNTLSLRAPDGTGDSPFSSSFGDVTFQMAPNAAAVTQVRLHFEADRCVYTASGPGGVTRVEAGHRQWRETSTSPVAGLPFPPSSSSVRVAARYSWASSHILAVQLQYVEAGTNAGLEIEFGPKMVTITFSRLNRTVETGQRWAGNSP